MWLTLLAIEHLNAEVKRRRAERARTISIEQDVPETPPTEEVSTLGHEILDFYEPDEDLKLEDLVPDLDAPTPEQEAAWNELRRRAVAVLASMPSEWRRILLLHHVDGLAGAELAKAVGRTKAETERILAHAREYLREKLREAGYGFKAAA